MWNQKKETSLRPDQHDYDQVEGLGGVEVGGCDDNFVSSNNLVHLKNEIVSGSKKVLNCQIQHKIGLP